jgi:membrane-associated protease RseP (regulator of RpoE activity)
MINLDTVGRLGTNKVLLLGADSAAEWVHILRGAGFVAGVEVESVFQELDASDQVSFHRAGIPAVQITTGPHPDYHRPSDTADKIDAAGLVKIASLAREVIEYLAKREGPLTIALKEGGDPAPAPPRKVSLGTIPDLAFSGPGVRLSGVVTGSPAEASGLREGDVLVEVNRVKLVRLKDLSEVLKSLNPGMRVTIGFLREGKQMTTETEVTGR